MCRETGRGDRCGGASRDEEDPRGGTPASLTTARLWTITLTQTRVPAISATQNQAPQSGLVFLHLGDGTIRGRISSSVGRGIIKEKKETRSVLFTPFDLIHTY